MGGAKDFYSTVYGTVSTRLADSFLLNPDLVHAFRVRGQGVGPKAPLRPCPLLNTPTVLDAWKIGWGCRLAAGLHVPLGRQLEGRVLVRVRVRVRVRVGVRVRVRVGVTVRVRIRIRVRVRIRIRIWLAQNPSPKPKRKPNQVGAKLRVRADLAVGLRPVL